jgi:hypothetical protein
MILLFIVGIPNIILIFLTLNSAYYPVIVVISFLIYAFVDGYVARTVAGWWEKEPGYYDDNENNDIGPPSSPLPP